MISRNTTSRDRRGSADSKLSKQWQEGLAAFAEASTDAFILFDENLNVLAMNPAMEKFAPLSKVASKGGNGNNILDHVPDLKERESYKEYLKVIKTGEPFNNDDYIVHPESGEMYLNIRAFKVGKGLGLLVTDITGRKQAEEALRESENNYRTLFESKIDGAVVIDAETMKIVLANETVAKTYGLDSIEEILEVDLLDHIHPDDRDRASKTITEDMFVNDLREVNEFRILTKDGRQRWISAVGSKIEYKGRKAGLVSFRDITEQKIAEEELRQSEEKYRLLLDSLNDAVGVVDVETLNIVFGNRQIAQLFGLNSVEEGISTSLLDYVFPEDRETVINYFASDLSGERRQRYEMRHCTKDGREVWISSLATRIDYQGRTSVLFSLRDITEQRRAEEEMRQSERKYKDLADLLPLSVFEIDENGVLTFFNHKFIEYSGYTQEEFGEGLGAFQMLVPGDRERARENMFGIMSGEKSVGTEYTALKKDGATFPVVIYSSAIIQDGKPVGLRGIAVDITERKQAEAALRESEEKFRNVLNNSLDMSYQLNLDTGRYDYLSPSSMEQIGYTPEEVMSHGFDTALSFIHPDDLQSLAENMGKLTAGNGSSGSARRVEFRFKHKVLGYRWFSDSRSIQRDEDGRPVAVVGTLRDITESKLAVAALRKSEEKFRNVLDSSLDHIYRLDLRTGAYDYVSPASLQVLGYTPGEYMSMSLQEAFSLIHPDDVPTLIENALKLVSGPGEEAAARRLEYRVKHRKLGYRWMSDYRSVIYDEHGRPVAVVGALRDVTERKRYEEAVREERDRAQQYLDVAGVIMVVIGADRKVRLINRRGCEILECSQEEITGKNWHTNFVPKRSKHTTSAVFKLLLAGQTEPVEYWENPVLTKSGKERIIAWHNTVLYDKCGTIEGVLSSGEDITERKQAQKALRESEERYRNLFENAQVGLFRSRTTDGKLLECNNLFAKLVGYNNRDECLAEYVTTEHYLDPTVREQMLVEIQEKGEVSNFEALVTRKDGSPFWVCYSNHIYPASGYMEGAAIDVTERKRAEEALQERLRFEQLLSQISTKFVNLPAAEVDRQVEEVLGLLVEFLDIDRSTLFEVAEDGICLQAAHSWAVEGVEPLPSYVTSELLPYCAAKVLRGEPIIYSRLEDLPEEADVDKQLLQLAGLKANLTIPLEVGNSVLGALAFGSLHSEREWPDELVQGLQIVAQVLANALERKRTEETLTQYRYHLEALVQERTYQLKTTNSRLKREIIEHKKAGEELRQAKEFTDKIMASMIDGLSVVNMDGTRLEANPALCRMTGFSREELLSQYPGPYWARESYDEIITNLYRAYIGEIDEFETVLMRKNGERFPVIVSGSTINDDKGNVTCFASTIKDITERKQAENALQEGEERYRQLVELSPAAVMVHSGGKVVFANAAAAALTGASTPEQLIGMSVLDFVRPYYRKDISQRIKDRQTGGGGSPPVETRMLKLDGTDAIVEAAASAISYQGKPAIQVVARDVTERTQMEAALKESESRYRAIFESSPISLWEEDFSEGKRYFDKLRRDGVTDFREYFEQHPEDVVKCIGMVRVIDVNQYTLNLYRARDKYALLSNLINVFGEESFPVFMEELIALANGETGFKGQGINHTLEGERLVVALALTVAPGYEDTLSKLYVAVVDITERKRAEDKLKRHYGRERKLRRQLEEEMKKRIEFTRALAHELKTPLTPVMMSSQILTNELKDDEILLRVASNISRGAQNLNSRIDELLDLARGEVGMLRIRPERMDLLELLLEVVEEVAPVPLSRGQSLKAKLPPALPPSLPLISADRGRVKQIVFNLLNNAFKYSPEGGVITLSARQEDSNVIVEVKDTGQGISKKEQGRIFNPYHRVDSDRERLSGLGLGLGLCKRLVELHKGKIWVTSHPGKGSNFAFSLPVHGLGEQEEEV